jgi:hypothetical protein
MKMKTILILLICICLFPQCNLKDANKNARNEEHIPEVFEDKSLYDRDSYRRQGNLVEALFEEYLKEDSQLQLKLEDYQNLLKHVKQKTQKYLKYASNVEDYYSSISNYVTYISDTLVKKSTEAKIGTAKQEQFYLSKEQAAKYKELQVLQNEIEVLITRIKIEKTLQIMLEYQEKVPSIAAENLKKNLDSLHQSLKKEL